MRATPPQLRHEGQEHAIANIAMALDPGVDFLFTSSAGHGFVGGEPMNGVPFAITRAMSTGIATYYARMARARCDAHGPRRDRLLPVAQDWMKWLLAIGDTLPRVIPNCAVLALCLESESLKRPARALRPGGGCLIPAGVAEGDEVQQAAFRHGCPLRMLRKQ